MSVLASQSRCKWPGHPQLVRDSLAVSEARPPCSTAHVETKSVKNQAPDFIGHSLHCEKSACFVGTVFGQPRYTGGLLI